jgi:cAMP phosphodiesterase
MNALLAETRLNLYSTRTVYDALATYLLNGELYPEFLTRPEGNPTINFTTMEPDKREQVDGYSILPVSVNHSIPAVGYQIASPDGKTVFYTGDTGTGLAECWQRVSPELLIIEVTAPNEYEEFCLESGHLSPALLKQELECFRELKGYLPQIITVHMNPRQEKKIEAETAAIASSLNSPVMLAHEGMIFNL